MVSRMWFLSCLALVVFFAACSSEGPSYVPCPNGDVDCPANATCVDGECKAADSCTGDGDCHDGRVCDGGFCRMPQCTQDSDCAAKQHCADNICVDGDCRVDQDCEANFFCDENYKCLANECATDGDCAPAEFCDSGRCKPRQVVNCTGDTECRDDELCLDGTCQIAPACSADTDCPTGTVCTDGKCARPCSVDADCPSGGIPQVCQDGHCLQQCINDNTCPGDKICEAGVCVDPFCSQDADCSGEHVRCRNGRCEEYTPCVDDNDCSDPNFTCIANICEELPLCSIAADCNGEQMCQARPCICTDSHCHQTPPCTNESDCDAEHDCVGGMCVPFVCRGKADCEAGKVCVGGECIDPGNPDTVYQVVILTPGGPIQSGQQIQLRALALTLNGQAIPGIDFDWSSTVPNRAAVDADGLLTGGAEAGDTLITATAQGTSPPVVSDPVTFTNVLAPATDTLRVTVVDRASRAAITGAQVMLVASGNTETQATASDGTATFTDPQASADIHVFDAGHDYVSILGTTSVDILVPLPPRSNPAKAGGFTGRMTIVGSGEVSLGLAGVSIGGNLVDLNFGRLLGDIFTVTVSIPGVGSFPVSLPAQMVLGVSFQGFPIDIKTTYYVEGQRGKRTAWGMGGTLGMNTFQDIIGSGTSVSEILVGLLPYFAVFDHGLKPNVDIFPIPKVADGDDIDGDGDSAEMRPDWTQLNSVDLSPTQPQSMSVFVTPPTLPMHGNARISTAVFLAGAMNSYGLTPLGLTSEAADANGTAGPLMMKMAPAYGGLQAGRYMMLILAVPSGDVNNMPTDVALVLYNEESLPADLTFESGFLGFPMDASYTPLNRTMVASGVTGSTLFRSTIRGALGKWEVYMANGQTVGYTLPDPPSGMDDLATGDSVTLDPISLRADLSFDDLVTFNGTDLDKVNVLMSACSRHEL
ncbi:MAG TPA: hypothetical protein VM425_02405 [Myxococcota bacterium]|nr:hypothetical protein [Myxococcota bacterium]